MNKKIVLAFSGGLDTSFCVPYLIDQGYEVHTLFVNTGGISVKEERSITKRANELGCLLYTSPSPRDQRGSRMPSSA